ncbi:hypothetical protein GUJ93_ZPchr0002g23778 [Zizania palustris]|uniref:Uncharacterized protein n=1 Tax=Zizania palustris TaxID=103762 RepID=A0A8J5S3U8_ZIZPA|nr:hypothetical protein GUJ93_ZPchr0002g23778 [Zizania palustris]
MRTYIYKLGNYSVLAAYVIHVLFQGNQIKNRRYIWIGLMQIEQGRHNRKEYSNNLQALSSPTPAICSSQKEKKI